MGVYYQLEGKSKENLALDNICAGFLLLCWGGWRGVVMVEAARAGAAVAGWRVRGQQPLVSQQQPHWTEQHHQQHTGTQQAHGVTSDQWSTARCHQQQ